MVPALAATDLDTLAEALGIAVGTDDSRRNAADALADVFEAPLARIAAYDDVTLERLATHVSEGGWQFAELFEPRFAGTLPCQQTPPAHAAGDRFFEGAHERTLSSRLGRWSRSILKSYKRSSDPRAHSLK